MTKTYAKQLACRTVAQLIRGYIQNDSWCIAANNGQWGALSEADFIRFTDAFKELEAEMWRRAGKATP